MKPNRIATMLPWVAVLTLAASVAYVWVVSR